MTSKFYNRARVSATPTVTDAITLGQALPGYNSFEDAGVQDGDTVTYLIEDGNNYEIGNGVYDTTTRTMTRDLVLKSKVYGNPSGTDHISVSSSAIVSIIVSAEDLAQMGLGVDLAAPSTYYFHGFAGGQTTSDAKFYDRSGAGNHGVFGANLSVANAWANAGFVSTVDPAGGTEDSVIRMPPLNFDFAGGEKLILWWLGKITAEGSNASWIGDGNFNISQAGVRIRMNSTGTTQLALSDGAAQDFSLTSAVVGDGTLRSMCWAVDGTTKSYGMWIDEVMNAAHDGKYAAITTIARDTRTNNTFNIGCPAPKPSASTDGIACQTRALAILRLSASDYMPPPSHLTRILEALRANPGGLLVEKSLKQYGARL